MQVSDTHNGYAYEDDIRQAYGADDDRNDYAEGGIKGEYMMEDAGDDLENMVFEDEIEDDEDVKGKEPITEEDAWKVISAHFHERGLVSQQLDSFDVFMTNTMQVRVPSLHVLSIEIVRDLRSF